MAYAKVASLGASGAWGKHDVGFKRGGRKEESWKKKNQKHKTSSKRPTASVTVMCCILCFLVCLNAVVQQAFLQH